MNLGQSVKMAVKSIVTRKGRSFLTMLGIIIGIASVMTIVSIVSGYNDKMMERFEAMGTNKVTAYMYFNNGESGFEDIYDYCQGLDDVVGVTPQGYLWDITIKHGAKSSMNMEQPPEVYLGSDQYAICNNFVIEKGRDLCYLDIEGYKQVCVLGARAAKNFFDYSDPIGQSLSFNGIPYQVIGVYEEKDPESSYSLDNIIVVPYTATRSLGQRVDLSQCTIKVKDSESVNKVITLLSGFIQGLTKNQTIGYGYAYSENSWIDSSNQELNVISLVLGGIAGISLLVGGIGIMNIMLVTVTERTREIGIRRAIGAKKSSIVTQFLIEASMICGIGGIIGIILGFGLTNLGGRLLFDGLSLLPSSGITLGAFAFSVVIGIIFGLYPAIKAARLQPVVALRAE